ncbi:DNA mismatch repair protein MSH1, mitochondrial [Zea mays]|uniref:DNA mismatch repair protein MSH1, mitochondrial n=1 Tax=Zea mays TaxID=4577 RepID=A0A3L6G7Z4_MAIZE|nr:DNA mismatch repair protein MSH1, mitochondrial [Zea mays]
MAAPRRLHPPAPPAALLPSSRAVSFAVSLWPYLWGIGFGMFDRRAWSKPRKVSRGISVASRKANKQGEYCDEKNGEVQKTIIHTIDSEACVFKYIRVGSEFKKRKVCLKDGTLNMEILVFKSKFPREVLLCRVGDFYEAIGFDACILVEHAGLNPFGEFTADIG